MIPELKTPTSKKKIVSVSAKSASAAPHRPKFKNFEEVCLKVEKMELKLTQYLTLSITEVKMGCENIPFEGLQNFFNNSATWIMTNARSPDAGLLCNLIYLLLRGKGFFPYFTLERALEFEMEIPPKLPNMDYNIISLESSILSLLLSICNMPNCMKFKSFLNILIKICSMFLYRKDFGDLIRKQKGIRALVKIQKLLYNQEILSREDKDLLVSLHALFSIFVNIRGKNREYYFIKGGVDYTAKIFKSYTFESEKNILLSTTFLLGSCAMTAENRIAIWVTGIITPLFNRLGTLVKGIKDSPAYLSKVKMELAWILYTLWKSSIENDEIQEDIQGNPSFEWIYNILSIDAPEVQVFAIAILRRMIQKEESQKAISEHLIPLIEGLLYTCLRENEEKELDSTTPLLIFKIKELMALIGALLLNKEAKEQICSNDKIILWCLELGFRYIAIPKLGKTTLGCLINLATSENGLLYMQKTQLLYDYVLKLLITYETKYTVVDYALKLILATCQTKLSGNIYNTMGILGLILHFLEIFDEFEEILLNSALIFRTICLQNTSIDLLKQSLKSKEESGAVFSENLLQTLMNIINKCITYPKVLSELFLIISNLSSKYEHIKKIIQNNTELSELIKKCLSKYSNKKTSLELLSQSIAHLPIEEIDLY